MTFSGRFALNMIRFAALQGASEAKLLALSGYAPSVLQTENPRLSAAQYGQIIAAAVAETGDPHLGLHAGEHLNLAAAGLVNQLVQTSSTLREALEHCCAFSLLGCPAIHLSLEEAHPYYCLRMQPDPVWAVQYPLAAQHTLEGHLAFSLREYQALLLDKQPPAKVHLMSKRPDNVAEYERIFRAELHFGQPEGALFFTARQMDSPVVTSDYDLMRVLLAHANERLAALQQSASAYYQVKYTIFQLMGLSLPTLEEVAANLNQSPRSLQRRLHDEGHTFQSITEALRQELAQSYLKQANLSLADIAALLGYADNSSFSRSFKRWTGVSPRAYRKREFDAAQNAS